MPHRLPVLAGVIDRPDWAALGPWEAAKFGVPFAAVAVAVAVAIGGYAIGNSLAGDANAAPAGQSGQPQVDGQAPQNWRPGTGTIITGAAADTATAAAVAKYPGGTVNRVLQLSDGSYAVHRIGTSAPHHIFVSKDFKVTGTA